MVGEKMREILFRGQTRRKGEKVWLDGSPVDSNWVYGGIFPNNNGGDFTLIYQQEPEIHKFPVYADTVGQFTGLTDKNGNKIFEGDIVRYELSAYGKSLTKDYEIVFHNYSWGCKNEKGNISRLDLFEPSLLEVIGNKHEK